MTWEMVSYSYKTNSYISFVPVKIFEWMFNVDVIDFELKKEPMQGLHLFTHLLMQQALPTDYVGRFSS